MTKYLKCECHISRPVIERIELLTSLSSVKSAVLWRVSQTLVRCLNQCQQPLDVTHVCVGGGGCEGVLCGNELYSSSFQGHRFSGSNIRFLSWFSPGQRKEKRWWCLSSSSGVKNAAHCWGNKIPDTSQLSSLLLKWEPLKSQGTAAPQNHRISTCVPDWHNPEGSAPSLLSQTKARPKETESVQLKLLDEHKRRVTSPSLCLWVFTPLFVNHTMDSKGPRF